MAVSWVPSSIARRPCRGCCSSVSKSRWWQGCWSDLLAQHHCSQPPSGPPGTTARQELGGPSTLRKVAWVVAPITRAIRLCARCLVEIGLAPDGGQQRLPEPMSQFECHLGDGCFIEVPQGQITETNQGQKGGGQAQSRQCDPGAEAGAEPERMDPLIT